MKVLVWWTDQAAAEIVDDLELTGWPAYLESQFNSRLGRAGRGRLWIDERFPSSIEIPQLLFDGMPLGKWITGAGMGGIVIDAADLRHVRDLPGLVTDLDLRRAA